MTNALVVVGRIAVAGSGMIIISNNSPVNVGRQAVVSRKANYPD